MLTSFIKWLVMAAVITVVPYVVDGIEVSDFGAALAVAIVLSLLNVVVKPILVVLTLPFTVLSFGLFLLVINSVILQLAGFFVAGFMVKSFGAAFLASLLISCVNTLLGVRHWRLNRRKPADDSRSGIVDLQQTQSGRWQ